MIKKCDKYFEIYVGQNILKLKHPMVILQVVIMKYPNNLGLQRQLHLAAVVVEVLGSFLLPQQINLSDKLLMLKVDLYFNAHFVTKPLDTRGIFNVIWLSSTPNLRLILANIARRFLPTSFI